MPEVEKINLLDSENPLEYLDEVLRNAFDKTSTDAKEINELTIDMKTANASLYSRLFQRDRVIIFEKLERDNYIRKMPVKEGNPDKWYINFEGIVFLRNGGYVQQQKDAKAERYHQNLLNRIVALGTGLTGLYVLWQVSLWLYHYFFCH